MHSFKNGELFFIFSTNVDNVYSSRKYLIQRIRKETREYFPAADRDPVINVTYLVEAFKLLDGKFKGKGGDIHCGNYALGNLYKREIIKDYEIGFGEIVNIAVGEEWPFGNHILYKEIHDYQPDRKIYDRVKFVESKEWSLTVAFNRSGWYSIRSPELGFNAPDKMP